MSQVLKAQQMYELVFEQRCPSRLKSCRCCVVMSHKEHCLSRVAIVMVFRKMFWISRLWLIWARTVFTNRLNSFSMTLKFFGNWCNFAMSMKTKICRPGMEISDGTSVLDIYVNEEFEKILLFFIFIWVKKWNRFYEIFFRTCNKYR